MKASSSFRNRWRCSINDQRLATTSYLVGPTFTVADLNVASVLSWARMGGVDLSGFPHVDQWLAGCLKRPAAVKARPAPMGPRSA
jgi:glutathione S-transferase